MKKTEEPLAQVRRWKREVSRITNKMKPQEVVKYFQSVHKDIMPLIKKA